MPKKYPKDFIAPSYSNEYHKIKMREHRKKNGITPKPFWCITINEKKYVFKTKKSMNIEKIQPASINQNEYILCL